jgi:hypothetical protein
MALLVAKQQAEAKARAALEQVCMKYVIREMKSQTCRQHFIREMKSQTRQATWHS